MLIGFEGRTIVVTGAARGIGGGIARAFAERGGKVLALDLLPVELAGVEAHRIDLGDRAAVKALLAGVEADVVVHAAGGVRGQSPVPFEEVEPEAWRDIYDANVTAAVNVLQALIPAMKRRRAGRIVTITSGAGLKPSLTGIQAYCSAKHALVGLTRQLAHDLGPHGITVNSVAPGFLRTSPDYERQWQSYGEAGQKAMVEKIAMRRLGEPEDIAHAVLFFASDYAGWITGQVLPVSGSPFP
ncbi:MAG: 3-hydroxybutyrate dehydrogenase [Thalassobaculales bacterium]